MRTWIIEFILLICCWDSLQAYTKIHAPLFDTIHSVRTFVTTYDEYPFILNETEDDFDAKTYHGEMIPSAVRQFYYFGIKGPMLEYFEAMKEYPYFKTEDWYDPDYSSYHDKMMPGFFTGLLESLKVIKPLWDPYLFEKLMRDVTETRELNGFMGSFVNKVTPQMGDKFILFGNLGGALHSLVRCLDKFIAQQHLDKDLMIIDPHVYIVFNGNVVSGSPYILETLTLIMVLMKKNPEHVFYLRGQLEDKGFWKEMGMRRELKKKAKVLSKRAIPLADLADEFFNTLPYALYLVEDSKEQTKNIVRISHWGLDYKDLDEETFAQFFTLKQPGIAIMKLTNKPVEKATPPHLKALIKNEALGINYRPTPGLQSTSKERGITIWTIFSSPTKASRKLYDFYFDAYSVLSIEDSINSWTIKLCNRDTRDVAGFMCEKAYNLLTGLPAGVKIPATGKEEKITKPAAEVKQPQAKISAQAPSTQQKEPLGSQAGPMNEEQINIGCSADISRGAKDTGQTIEKTLQVLFEDYNKKKTHRTIKFTFLDDKYQPALTKANIQTLLKDYDTEIITSLVGSNNFAECIDLIKEGKIAALFPIPGIPSGIPSDLKYCITFRPSYLDETYILTKFMIKKFNISQVEHIAFIYQDDLFGQACLEGAKKAIAEAGIGSLNKVIAFSHARNYVNFADIYESIKKTDADYIGLLTISTAAAEFVRQADATILQKKFFGISDLGHTTTMLESIKKMKIIVSHIVPDPQHSNLPIVTQYHTFISSHGIDNNTASLEAYINATLLIDVIDKIVGPVSKDTLISYIENNFNNVEFQGLKLKFDAQKRSLSNVVWVDDGSNGWQENLLSSSEPEIQKKPGKEEAVLKGEKTEPVLKETSEGQPLHIGITIDFTSGTKDLGKSIVDVFQPFFDQHNAKQSESSKKIYYSTLDDEYSPSKTRKNLETFITQFNIDIILNLLGSENFDACLDLIKQKKVAVIFPIPGPSKGCPVDLTNCIVFRPSYLDESYILMRYMVEKFNVTKPNDIIFFYQDDSFGKTCVEGAKKALTDLNLSPVDEVQKIPYSRNDLNFSDEYEILKKSKASIVVLFATPKQALQLMEYADETIYQRKFCGISILGYMTFQNFVKNKGLKVIMSHVVPNPETSNLPIVNKYRKFIKTAGLTISPWTLEVYINASLFAEAITKMNGPINKETLLTTMDNIFRDYSFQGLNLKLDTKTRNLSHSVWIEDDSNDWKEIAIKKAGT